MTLKKFNFCVYCGKIGFFNVLFFHQSSVIFSPNDFYFEMYSIDIKIIFNYHFKITIKGLTMSKNTQSTKKPSIAKKPKIHYKKNEKISAVKISKNSKKKVRAKGTSSTKLLQIQTNLEAVVTNPVTGESEKLDTVLYRRVIGDFDYDKVFLLNLLEGIGVIGGAKFQASMWILKHKDENNYVFVTGEKLAKACNISIQSAHITLRLLKESNFLTQPKGTIGGVYQINPDMIFKGSHNKRMSVLTVYEKNREQVLPPFDEERIDNGKK